MALAAALPLAIDVHAQARPAEALTGVYQAIAAGTVLTGGLKNAGGPNEISLRSDAPLKRLDLRDDPAVMCQSVGPFRMMARDRVKLEIVPGPGIVMLLFEDLAHGQVRPVYLNRRHQGNAAATRLGDAVGRWDGATLVVETRGFDERALLNDSGVQHSGALTLTERLRPVLGGRYLEYQVTAADPQTLAQPYSYTRYFEKLQTEIEEDICLFD
jgi:hypothetical protein